MRKFQVTTTAAALTLSIIGISVTPAVAEATSTTVSSTRFVQPMHQDGKWTGSHGFLESKWYGLHLHLDAYAANKVIGGAWLGSGASALLAAIGAGGLAAPITSAVLAMAAGGTQLCQKQDGSVDIYQAQGNVPPVCNPLG